MEFTQSSEYKVLYNYPQSTLKMTIEVIDDFELLQSWDEDSISKFLVLLENTSEYSYNPEVDGALLAVYNIVKAYFNYLVTKKKLEMSREQLQDLLEYFEKENELYFLPRFNNVQTGLKKWSWQTAYEIDLTIDKWINAYNKASKERIIQANLFEYMRNLSKQIYDCYRLTPNNWNRKVIEETIIISSLSQPVMTKDYCLARNKEVANLLNYVVSQQWMKERQANIINQSLQASIKDASETLTHFDDSEPEMGYADKVRDFSITNEGFILRLLYEIDKFATRDEEADDRLPF
ncbi:hypothetical protein [Companilactobacillus farciminis]|uniref:hypothetical protein n=1 Tax=Companilactobacillus farciminis TaxID=1612 RepID=UPI00241D1960|nr:hypothetical protein [Companilactobacillus farciminis]